MPFVLILAASGVAQAKGAGQAYDLYQVSLSARGCKVTALVNGKVDANLSGDGTYGMTSSVPLYGSGPARPYSITLKLDSLGEDPWVSLNVVGAFTDQEQVVDTLAPGGVLSQVWDAKKIRAAKKKEFTAKWQARWRNKPSSEDKPAVALSAEERDVLLKYGRSLLKVFQDRDSAALANELFPLMKTRAPAGLSDQEVRDEVRKECDKLLTGSSLQPVEASQIELLPVRGGKEYQLAVAGEPMIRVRSPATTPDRFAPIEICVALVNGKPQIVRVEN